MNSKAPIYLDFNASTPPDPSAIEAMSASIRSGHANPHSSHLSGQRAAAEIDLAISNIRKLINANSGEIIFTSGATESNNLALLGTASADPSNTHVFCTSIEHKSVLEVANEMGLRGAAVSIIPVSSDGYISPRLVEDQLTLSSKVIKIVSIIHANNEIGTIQPINEIAALKRKYNFVLHVDAAQSAGKVKIDLESTDIDLLSFSSHKLYGPAGIGAIYVSKDARSLLKPLMYGGGQQNGLRPGSLPTFLISGFGAACEKADRLMSSDSEQCSYLSELFCKNLTNFGVSFKRISPIRDGLPGLLSIYFDDIEGDDLVLKIAPLISISTGSACNAKELKSSHVLRALGLSECEARNVVRIGFGRFSTKDHAAFAAEVIATAIRRAP